MVATERDLLIASLKGYLEELKESGVDELMFATVPAAVCAPIHEATAPPVRQATPAAEASGDTAPRSILRQDGDPGSRLWLVMSGHGYAGEAGEMLAKMIKAMKFETSEVCLVSFDAAAVPQREEVFARFAEGAPEVVVAFGAEAAGLLLPSAGPLEKLRGKFHQVSKVAVMPTLHPAQMLVDQSLKRQVWSELQQVMRRLAGEWDH